MTALSRLLYLCSTCTYYGCIVNPCYIVLYLYLYPVCYSNISHAPSKEKETLSDRTSAGQFSTWDIYIYGWIWPASGSVTLPTPALHPRNIEYLEYSTLHIPYIRRPLNTLLNPTWGAAVPETGHILLHRAKVTCRCTNGTQFGNVSWHNRRGWRGGVLSRYFSL